jgi:aspartyl/asparaginyl beta-hydroxylase (cupin superfamily)
MTEKPLYEKTLTPGLPGLVPGVTRSQIKGRDFQLGKIITLLWPVVWLNAFFNRYTGGSTRPAFFDIDKTFPALNVLTEHFAVIREELDTILAAKSTIPNYHEIDFIQFPISAKVDKYRNWKVFILDAMGERPAANRVLCPQTSELLARIPDLFQAFFSILDPGKSIPSHTGPYSGYLRYHLALKVPQKDPPSMRVKDQWYVWQEGKAILFDDTYDHEVLNRSAEERVVLVVDVLRPMPPFAHSINRLVRVASRYVYAKGVIKVSPAVSRIVTFLVRMRIANANRDLES